MMADDIEIEDVEEALSRADELADLTGRKKADIVADLLDDGQLNMSAGSDSEPNKDFLDVAQEQAEKLKTLLTTLIPILALLMGIGAEGMGIVDVTGWGEDSVWDGDGPSQIWGCTNPDADNYDDRANADDGSCHWDDNHGGGGGPPCNEDWRWENVNIRDSDMNGQGFNNDIEVDMDFEDWNDCNRLMSGAFILQLWNNDGNSQYDSHEMNPEFHNDFHLRHTYQDLPESDYTFSVTYHFEGSHWEGPSQLITTEGEDEEGTLDIQNQQLSIVGDNELKAEFNLLVEGDFCCDDIEIIWEVEVDGYYDDGLRRVTHHSYDEEGYISLEQYWNDMPDANYHARMEVRWMNEMKDEETTNGVTIETEPEPEPCSAAIDNFQVNVDENTVELDFYLQVDEDTDCPSHLTVEFILRSDSNTITHESVVDTLDSTHSWDFEDVPNGEWAPEIVVTAGDEELDDDALETITVDYVETCEINLYWVAIATNATHAQMGYDLDCGEEPNDLDGYNVSVQFLVYEVGSDNATNGSQPQPILWETGFHYIQGWVEDNQILTLTNFTGSNNTHYDFYGYFIWTDADGEQQVIEHKWLNRELEP